MKKILTYIVILFLCFIGYAQIPTDVPLELHAQFNGRYDYTVIGNTHNEFDNWQSPQPPCQMLTESSATLNLLPSQNIIAAYLYWSGIGDGTFDSNILLNGQPITPQETLVVDPELNNFFYYYASFKDVTEQVSSLGNTTYTLSDWDLNPIIDPYCTNAIFYAGWSILIIYEDTNLPIQQLNVYKGIATVEGNVGSNNFSTTITIGSLNVTDISNATMGFLAWNGSPNLFGGESISFNNTVLSDALNPADNPFNGTNNYTGATDLWNMDLDVFDISNLIQVGDTQATLTFTSSFFRFIQNVVAVIPSELPDATLSNIAISNQDPCDDRDITLNLNVNNLNSFEVLPANTPWSIFALDSDDNEVFIASFFTQNALPIDGSETQTVDISIPPNIPNSTTLILRANTLQDGSNPTNESNILNNEVTLTLVLPQTPSIANLPEDINLCGSIADNTVIDLTQNNLASLGVQHPEEYTMSYHLSDAEAQNGNNPIIDPENFIATSNPQSIYIRVESMLSPACFAVTDFEVSYSAIPQIQQTLDINDCIVNGVEPTFDLTVNNAVSMGISDPATTVISYHNTLNDAQNGINNFVGVDITNFGFTGNTTATIYVRAQNANNPNCFSIGSFQLNQYPVTVNSLQDLNTEACTSLGQDAVFDLTVNTPLALGTQSPQDFSVSYHLSENEAQNGTNAIANPETYTSNALSQSIWLRLTLNTAPTACSALGSFTLETSPLTVVNNVSDLSIQACVFPNAPVSFNLTQNTAIALGSQDPQGFDISYHTSESEAQNGTNAIVNPTNYNNTSNPQTLWLRLERNDVTPLCYAIAPFDIEVVGTPVINFNPSPLQICASDGNGFAEFDLSQSIIDISLGNPDISVSFHDTIINVQNNTNPLPLSYTNTVAGSQTIYYRTEDTINGCSFTGTLELQVLEVPEFSTNVPALSTCAVDNNIGVFNLSDIEPLLIENADDTDFGIQYFLSESDALNGTNAIANPNGFNNTSNPQTLWLGVANSNSCYAIASFELNVLNSTVISDNVIINDIAICSEDPTTLLATVDLGQYDTLINPNALPNTQVHYYEGWDNFNLGIAIENPQNYITTVPSITIVARIFNSETQCRSPEPIAFNVNINPLPTFSLPEVLPLCVDAQTGEPLNLSFSPPVLDTGLAGSSNTFTWLRNGETLGFNTSSILANLPGNYTVIVTDFGTGCSYSQTTLVEAVSPPEFEVVVLSPSFSQTGAVEVRNIIGQGNFEFRLDNGPWQSLDEEQTSLLFTNVGDGTHTIRGRDLEGCGFFEVEFMVLGFPPYFTPNGDGNNDVWGIPSLGDQRNARIKIFDRYGKILTVLGTQQLGWDGSYDGNPMPTNDYWFSVEFIDPRTNRPTVFKSHFTLKR